MSICHTSRHSIVRTPNWIRPLQSYSPNLPVKAGHSCQRFWASFYQTCTRPISRLWIAFYYKVAFLFTCTPQFPSTHPNIFLTISIYTSIICHIPWHQDLITWDLLVSARQRRSVRISSTTIPALRILTKRMSMKIHDWTPRTFLTVLCLWTRRPDCDKCWLDQELWCV